jgi:hypothetical protein
MAPHVWALGAGGVGVGLMFASPTACDGQPDRLESWTTKWNEKYNGKPAFHQKNVNEYLSSFYSKVFTDAKKKRVLVPLCGKTVDMPYLAGRGHEVVGVEGVQKAIEEFAEEQFIVMQQAGWIDGRKSAKAGFRPYVANPDQSRMDLAILVGDWFDLTGDKIGGRVDVIYDRASLVAIEPSSRSEYADVVKDTLKVRQAPHFSNTFFDFLARPFSPLYLSKGQRQVPSCRGGVRPAAHARAAFQCDTRGRLYTLSCAWLQSGATIEEERGNARRKVGQHWRRLHVRLPPHKDGLRSG